MVIRFLLLWRRSSLVKKAHVETITLMESHWKSKWLTGDHNVFRRIRLQPNYGFHFRIRTQFRFQILKRLMEPWLPQLIMWNTVPSIKLWDKNAHKSRQAGKWLVIEHRRRFVNTIYFFTFPTFIQCCRVCPLTANSKLSEHSCRDSTRSLIYKSRNVIANWSATSLTSDI